MRSCSLSFHPSHSAVECPAPKCRIGLLLWLQSLHCRLQAARQVTAQVISIVMSTSDLTIPDPSLMHHILKTGTCFECVHVRSEPMYPCVKGRVSWNHGAAKVCLLPTFRLMNLQKWSAHRGSAQHNSEQQATGTTCQHPDCYAGPIALVYGWRNFWPQRVRDADHRDEGQLGFHCAWLQPVPVFSLLMWQLLRG